MQYFDEVGNRTVIEAPFTLFDEQVKVLLGNAVIAPQVPLGLVPEVLNPINVINVLCEQFRMVNPDVMKLGNIQNIIAPKLSV